MAVNTRPANRRGMVPVGTIISFYDFGPAGPGGVPLTFDVKTWKYCDGTNVVDADSPLNGLTTPDLSGRYLVGFSAINTEGGGDIGTEPWATGAVGNIGNIRDLSHVHPIPAHDHTLNSHYHFAGGLHNGHTGTMSTSFNTGSDGDHVHRWMTTAGHTYNSAGTDIGVAWNDGGGSFCPGSDGDNQTSHYPFYTDSEAAHTHTVTMPATRETSGPDTANTGLKAIFNTSAASPVLTAQDIRPRSIRVRFLLRIA